MESLSSDAIKEEIMTALALLDQENATVAGVQELLPHYSIRVIRYYLLDLKKDGYLTSTLGKGRGNHPAYHYKTTKKEYKIAAQEPLPEGQVSDPLHLKNPRGFVVKTPTSPVPPSAPIDENLQMWTDRLNRVISLLTELKELTPTVLAAVLDLSRDVERLAKVKDALNRIKAIAKRNI